MIEACDTLPEDGCKNSEQSQPIVFSIPEDDMKGPLALLHIHLNTYVEIIRIKLSINEFLVQNNLTLFLSTQSDYEFYAVSM